MVTNRIEVGRHIPEEMREVKRRMPHHVNVRDIAEHILDTFYDPDFKEPFAFADLGCGYTKQEAVSLYNESKGERFALSALLNGYIMYYSRGCREYFPPYGIVPEAMPDGTNKVIESFDEKDPFGDLCKSAMWTLHLERGALIDDIEAGKTPEFMQKTLNRLKAWSTFCNDYLDKIGDEFKLSEDAILLMVDPYKKDDFPGLATGLQTICGLLEVIPKVASRDLGYMPSPESLLEIAEESVSHIFESSMFDHNTFNGIEVAMYGKVHKEEDMKSLNKLNPARFKLVKVDDKYRVTFADTVWDAVMVYLMAYPNGSGNTLTARCPARATVNEFCAMSELYGWLTDMAGDIFKNCYDSLLTS